MFVVTFIALWALSHPVEAAPAAYTLSSGSVTSANGFVECSDRGTFDTTGSSYSTCTRNFEVTGSGSYTSAAGYGDLHAQAFAAAGNAMATYQGGSDTAAEFQDSFTAFSSTCTTCLFSGTFTVTATLDGGAYARNPVDNSNGQLTLSLINTRDPGLLRDQEGASIHPGAFNGGGTSSTNGICGVGSGDPVNGYSATGNCLVTAQVPYTLGDTISLFASLQATAQSAPYLDQSTGTIYDGLAHADFYNTAKITDIAMYDSNGNRMNDIVFTAASGTVYPAAVPIPAAVWLFGSGLLGLVGVARRGNARRS